MSKELFKVYMSESAIEKSRNVLASGHITEGVYAHKFESSFQEMIGNPNTAVVNSGTSAITLALRLAGVGPGDEVISSPMTCLATNEPILTAGADVVWADVDPSTGNIDPETIEPLITPKTKAIMFVDWAGIPAEIDAINKIAKDYGLKVIEDAAHSLGARYKGCQVGQNSDYTCFSFQAIKFLTTVDGGAIACSNKEDYERVKLLRWFGAERANTPRNPVCWQGDVTEPGYKMHMNDVAAAIGLGNIEGAKKNIFKHKSNARELEEKLRYVDGVELLKIPGYLDPSYWIYTIKLQDSQKREQVSEALSAGIGSNSPDAFQETMREHRIRDRGFIGHSIVHTRNDKYSLFSSYKRDLPGLDDFGSRMLNIPCGWWLELNEIDSIVARIRFGLNEL